MKLILTSRGLETDKLIKEFSNMLERNVNYAKVMIIHTAKKPEHFINLDKIGKKFSKMGLLLPNIAYFDISQKNFSPKLTEMDAVYVCGGNTFYILDRLRKTGLDKTISRFVRNKGIYIGVSAGSIIAGKSIEISGLGSGRDLNEINLKNLRGLCLTDIAIFPHYKSRQKREVEEFNHKVNYPIKAIRDKEAIIIHGKKIKKV